MTSRSMACLLLALCACGEQASGASHETDPEAMETDDDVRLDVGVADSASPDETGDETGSDGEDEPGDIGSDLPEEGDESDCARGEWSFALPALEIEGAKAEAVDILQLDASFVLDIAAQTASVTGEMTFEHSPHGGRPLFAWEQDAGAVWLDGEFVQAEALLTEDLGASIGVMRAIDRELQPCTVHTVAFEFEIDAPPSKNPDYYLDPLGWAEDGVRWELSSTDLEPGGYLERWLPANLIHDRFDVAVELEIVGGAEHAVVTNAAVETLGVDHWSLEWSHVSSMSVMLVIDRVDQLQSSTLEVDLDGVSVSVDLVVHGSLADEVDPALELEVEGYLQHFSAEAGAFVHPRFTMLITEPVPGFKSMEYRGAAISRLDSKIIAHEIHHNWWARGLSPLTQSDGWLDEAWTAYRVDHKMFDSETVWGCAAKPPPYLDGAEPVELSPADPWNRRTPYFQGANPYCDGAQLFMSLADSIGEQALVDSMAALFAAKAPGTITTEELERHLHCKAQVPDVRQAFHRYVRGLDGEVAPPPDDLCD